uniref:Eukaryotic translation initiation factor 4E type 2 n=1 Tax=Sparus aurata TaxID=8175 RepID=A0A671ULN5_SPAAU
MKRTRKSQTVTMTTVTGPTTTTTITDGRQCVQVQVNTLSSITTPVCLPPVSLSVCRQCVQVQTVCPGAGEHPLQYNYTFWYSRRTPSRPASSQSYEQNIRQIGTVASVEQFWRFYSHLVRPGDLSGHSDFHLFKEGIKPMWEDESNRSGGKWIIRLRKGLASRFWENIILAMLGEQFMVGEEICGAVVSIRFQEDILSIWNRTSNDQMTTSRIRDTLRRVLNLPTNTIMEYKTHNDSLRDNSSFRNTKISL